MVGAVRAGGGSSGSSARKRSATSVQRLLLQNEQIIVDLGVLCEGISNSAVTNVQYGLR